jgi:hypothetical protein
MCRPLVSRGWTELFRCRISPFRRSSFRVKSISGGGILQGVGTVIASQVLNQGTVAPGNSAGVLLVFGNYIQTDAGVLLIEIGGLAQGTEYDVLGVLGSASLNGKLDIDLISGFVPNADATFDILLTLGTVTGTFSALDFPDLPNGDWSVLYLADRVRLHFEFDETQPPNPPPGQVPEPSGFVLLLFGLVAMTLMRQGFRKTIH